LSTDFGEILFAIREHLAPSRQIHVQVVIYLGPVWWVCIEETQLAGIFAFPYTLSGSFGDSGGLLVGFDAFHLFSSPSSIASFVHVAVVFGRTLFDQLQQFGWGRSILWIKALATPDKINQVFAVSKIGKLVEYGWR
jgi:hypothetical protein